MLIQAVCGVLQVPLYREIAEFFKKNARIFWAEWSIDFIASRHCFLQRSVLWRLFKQNGSLCYYYAV